MLTPCHSFERRLNILCVEIFANLQLVPKLALMPQNHAHFLNCDLKDTVTEDEPLSFLRKLLCGILRSKKFDFPAIKLLGSSVLCCTQCVCTTDCCLPWRLTSGWLSWLTGMEFKWFNLAVFPYFRNFIGTNGSHSDILTSHFSRVVMIKKECLLGPWCFRWCNYTVWPLRRLFLGAWSNHRMQS